MVLSLALNSATSGLGASQKAIETISHNITNINTPGYTRKIYSTKSRVFDNVGQGVASAGIIRHVDEALNKAIRSQMSDLEYLRQSNSYFTRMQNLLGTTGSQSSFAHQIGRLAAAVQQLADQPQEASMQIGFKRAVEDVVYQFNTVGKALDTVRVEADQDIAGAIEQVNMCVNNIHLLNREIGKGLSTNRDITNLLDQRDYQLQLLNEMVEVDSFDLGDGTLGIYTKGGTPLLDAQPYRLVHSAVTGAGPADTYAGGGFGAITVVDTNGAPLDSTRIGPNQDITKDMKGGRIGAAIELRDKTAVDYQAQMDELSVQLQQLMNQINNRGTSYPTIVSSMQGSRVFAGPDVSTMVMGQEANTRVVILGQDGKEIVSKDISDIVASKTSKDIHDPANAPTVREVATAVEEWLRDARPGGGGFPDAEFRWDDKTRTFNLDLKSNEASIVFHDYNSQKASEDVAIELSVNGQAPSERDIKGFSNFFGFNDILERSGTEYIYDSGIRSEGWRVSTSGSLSFYVANNTGGLTLLGGKTLSVGANDTLATIADRINQDPDFQGKIKAEVIPEGGGYRLRIKNKEGDDMIVTQGAGETVLDQLGMKRANVGAAGSLRLNPVLASEPERVSRGDLGYNADTGLWRSEGEGGNTTLIAMERALKAGVDFPSTGGLTSGKRTVQEYASLIMSYNSTQANDVQNRYLYATDMVNQLLVEQGDISGVDMNEEFAQLIIWQKMFQASAKVVSATTDMLDSLLAMKS
ncbi:flagellar hook-associated protein FlgK [Phaeovibrio sulfidiphilus]|uniref:Flagellar hook-associated protein 1 n=1 Tax=Phaeovibrio sulfidiphilus TaxID=1220600 RepID=A0A8J6YQ12_9PROT|nr:flagellar hook-associated protein FlgK [Phaeovibrio sulfidiphilus]MBE1237586.1 flagellar hook-associated protein FlgK [Phaeovibrio sulfidiphilus]